MKNVFIINVIIGACCFFAAGTINILPKLLPNVVDGSGQQIRESSVGIINTVSLYVPASRDERIAVIPVSELKKIEGEAGLIRESAELQYYLNLMARSLTGMVLMVAGLSLVVINYKFMKKAAQQVDSAEASTNAVPPSMPSGSPR